MLKTTIFVVLASLVAADVSRAQREPVPVPSTREGEPCDGRAARITVPGNSRTSPSTTTCRDAQGAPIACGYVLTYNAPVTTCAATPDKCCIQQVQQNYTQSFDCRTQPGYGGQNPPTVCVGGTKNLFGPTAIVDVTVGCHEGKCLKAGEY